MYFMKLQRILRQGNRLGVISTSVAKIVPGLKVEPTMTLSLRKSPLPLPCKCRTTSEFA
jgi:hypothetical protein